jgi:hypothetical protein
MSGKLKINSIIIFALAALFVFFFDFTKHNLTLSPVNPFADDPYDAIGTFALQAAAFLGFLSLVRAFRPYGKEQPSDEQKLILVRTQTAAVLGVFVALAGDIVAMMRHLSLWSGTPAGYGLVILIVGFSLLATAIGLFVRHSAKEIGSPIGLNSWKKPAIVSLIFFIVLFFYPESIRESTLGALFTVVVGATLLFMPVWAWGQFLCPGVDMERKTVTSRWVWGIVILIGILLGFTIVLRELWEGGGTIDIASNAFIVSVYIGLEVAGVLIGYGFLGKFLGLFQSQR